MLRFLITVLGLLVTMAGPAFATTYKIELTGSLRAAQNPLPQFFTVGDPFRLSARFDTNSENRVFLPEFGQDRASYTLTELQFVTTAYSATATGGSFSISNNPLFKDEAIGEKVPRDFFQVFVSSDDFTGPALDNFLLHQISANIFTDPSTFDDPSISQNFDLSGTDLLTHEGLFDQTTRSTSNLAFRDSTSSNSPVAAFTIDRVTVTAVPLPASLLLLGSAIMGVGLVRWKSGHPRS
ncbi:hypothetical protein EOI86_06035 [Hwanghaeella grinnelliae]|uniref:PEP-CTERM sorting domain-containing protein n=1 Tax=Hwanghaeella grinnelliae TaxID=2500179 RepID=A0A3S2VSK2_9PROT|nr:VPLPA-CTERM sorting domain-containing protein [Hwanghaeella grinnelliae]RVU38825.1 hypothetical protein EOI86_06035 [Hwanghaeella grinnelliae]